MMVCSNSKNKQLQERFIRVEHAYCSGSDSVDRSIIPAFRAGDPGSNPGRSMYSHALMLFSFFPLLIAERLILDGSRIFSVADP